MEERFSAFTLLISKIQRQIRRIKTGEMAEYDLKSPHVSCLYYIYKSKSLTSKELCDICDEDKANVSRSIKHLEENGYLECHAKQKKRYQSPLELTEKGRKIASVIADKIDSILRKASEGLCDNDREVFYRSFAIIEGNLKKLCDGYET